MNKVAQMTSSLKNFLTEVQVELKKCAWPTRPELLESTIVVIVAMIILAIVVGISDVILMWIMKIVIR